MASETESYRCVNAGRAIAVDSASRKPDAPRFCLAQLLLALVSVALVAPRSGHCARLVDRLERYRAEDGGNAGGPSRGEKMLHGRAAEATRASVVEVSRAERLGWTLGPRVYVRASHPQRRRDIELRRQSSENEEAKRKEKEEEEKTKRKEREQEEETKRKEGEEEDETKRKEREEEEETKRKEAEEEEETKRKEEEEEEGTKKKKEQNGVRAQSGGKKEREGWVMFKPEEEGEGESGGHSSIELMPGQIGSTVSKYIQKRAAKMDLNGGATANPARPGSSSGSIGAISWPGIGGSAGPVLFRGGPIMSNPITVYNIFYGRWTPGSRSEAIFNNFVGSLTNYSADVKGVSVRKWWKIATAYTGLNSTNVSSSIQVGQNIYINTNYSRNLSEDDIGDIVMNLITNGTLPLSSDAMYIVLTSKDVNVGPAGQGFCYWYCGWHSYWKNDGQPTIRFGFIGDATKCEVCSYYGMTINGEPSADSMIPAYAHEIAEMATDPDIDAYFAKAVGAGDVNGAIQENADLCNGVYEDSKNRLKWNYNPKKQLSPWNIYGINGFRHFIYYNVNLKLQKCVLQN